METKDRKKYIFYLIITITTAACSRYPAGVEQALKMAGENRPELEKVLTHYRQNPADSLKYKAAVFLIENLPGHYSYKYPDFVQSYYDELCRSVRLDCNNLTNKQIIEDISAGYNNDKRIRTFVWDIQTITGNYLIDNIEQAFDVWENGEWATQVSFDDFCEYILPYKGDELQPLDNWREYARDMLKGDIELLHYSDHYKNLTFQAATYVNEEIKKIRHLEYPPGDVQCIPLKDIRTIAQMPFGSCADYTFLATSVMRSKGIPVMEDFTPQWPFQAKSHLWNIVLNNYGKNLIFSAAYTNPGEPHKPDERMAKVFRRCYAINREILSVNTSEKSVPNTFKNFCIRDVTDEYMVTDDVEIEIPKTFKNRYRYAYLAVFDNKNWIPVQYGKVKGRKVRFTKMGRNCMYLPVFYDENQVIPFSAPFNLSPKGNINRFEIDKTRTATVHVYRKYFVGRNCYAVGRRMRGGRFEAANRKDFKDAVLIHQISDFTVQSGMIQTDTIETSYRYWRYYSADSCHSNIAELYFYQQGQEKPVYGEIIGTKGAYNNHPVLTKEAVFDNDPLTFFDAAEPSGAWVGMDFGKPVKIDHISYTPRGDGNDITPGDTHELLYWDGRQWVSSGKRVANDIVLVYENVPVNTIYWIRNHSRGKDERIFTCKDGKQVWW